MSPIQRLAPLAHAVFGSSLAPHPSAPQRLVFLDALRGIAALSVFFYHAGVVAGHTVAARSVSSSTSAISA